VQHRETESKKTTTFYRKSSALCALGQYWYEDGLITQQPKTVRSGPPAKIR